VRRVLLSPGWLLGHVLALAAAVVCVRLGWWQWQRAHATGSLQNLGYAVQWPAFAMFILALWFRVVRDALRPPSPPTAAPRSEAAKAAARPAPPALAADDPEDAELIAYNRYLAWLHEQDSRRPG
jgi:DNA-binding transcriptional regulator of glucitol operon